LKKGHQTANISVVLISNTLYPLHSALLFPLTLYYKKLSWRWQRARR